MPTLARNPRVSCMGRTATPEATERGSHPTPDSLDPDALLMRALARNDQAAARELCHRFADRVFMIGIRALGDSPSAQDLVQDTMLQVWQVAERFDPGRGTLDAWVHTIARRKAIGTL